MRLEDLTETVRGPAKVDEFCGKEMGLTGDKKYGLIDFDLTPSLLEVLGQSPSGIPFAEWLSNEVIPEKRHKKRAIEWHRNEEKYESSATWINRLVEWEWIPCLDGRDRRPAEVLDEADEARPDAPVAKLPKSFLRLLIDELGIEFGKQISDAPAILKLDVRGATMSDDEMTVTLEEAFRMAGQSDQGNQSFLAAIDRPIFRDPKTDKRYPISRLVQTVGSGSLRSDLGGFVLAVNSLSNEPLRNAVARLSIPPTTSGTQALRYLQSVWNGVSQRPETSADQVRRILPLAYRYVADDIDSGDDKLRASFEEIRLEAFAFANSKWISANDPRVILDDLRDEQLRRQLGDGHLWVTPGHFGEDLPQQKRTATLLGVKSLSDQIERTVFRGSSSSHPDWIERFKTVCALFHEIQTHETDGRESSEENPVKRAFNLTLRPFESLKLETQHTFDESLVLPDIDIRATLSEDDEFLDVAGEPYEFGADACAQLVKLWSQNQVTVAPERLTSLLVFLDDVIRFNRQINQLRQQYNLGSEPVASLAGPAEPSTTADAIKNLGIPDPTPPIPDPTGPEPRGTDTVAPGASDPRRNASGGPGTSGSGTGGLDRPDRPTSSRSSAKGEGSSSRGTPTQGRRLGGKSAPSVQGGSGAAARDWFRVKVSPVSERDERDSEKAETELRDDDRAREAVVLFENANGRKAKPAGKLQAGHDVISVDEGRHIVRRIEIKGVADQWNDTATVHASGRQFDDGRYLSEPGIEYWLYVVDRLGSTRPRIRAFRHAMRNAAHFYFQAQDWLNAVDEQGEVHMPHPENTGVDVPGEKTKLLLPR